MPQDIWSVSCIAPFNDHLSVVLLASDNAVYFISVSRVSLVCYLWRVTVESCFYSDVPLSFLPPAAIHCLAVRWQPLKSFHSWGTDPRRKTERRLSTAVQCVRHLIIHLLSPSRLYTHSTWVSPCADMLIDKQNVYLKTNKTYWKYAGINCLATFLLKRLSQDQCYLKVFTALSNNISLSVLLSHNTSHKTFM